MSVIKYKGNDYIGENTTYTLSRRIVEDTCEITLTPSVGEPTTIVIPISGGGSSAILDNEMLDDSTNGVQNKVIKKYVDNGAIEFINTLINKGTYNLLNTVESHPTTAIDKNITYVINDNGSILVTGNSGTSLSSFEVPYYIREVTMLEKRLSGCPKGGSKTTYCLVATSTTGIEFYDTGDGVVIPSNTDISIIEIRITGSSNLTFYPLLTTIDAHGNYPTEYVPYVNYKSISELVKELNTMATREYVNDSICNAAMQPSYNLIPFPYIFTSQTISGVSINVENNGAVKVNGTASATARVSLIRCTEDNSPLSTGKRYKYIDSMFGGSNIGYVTIRFKNKVTGETRGIDIKSKEVDFTVENNEYFYDVNFYIKEGWSISNYTFHPMIVEVAEDGTYPTSYIRGDIKSNLELTDDSNKLKTNLDTATTIFNNGSYNLIPYPYYQTVMTQSGITFTASETGEIKVNGTATADVAFYLMRGETVKLTKKCKLMGAPADASYSTYSLDMFENNDGTWVNRVTTFENDGIAEAGYEIYAMRILIKNGQTVNNLSFKPMLVEVNANNTYPTKYIRGNVKGNLGLTSVANRLEKKIGYNLIPYPYSQTSITHNGVTFTTNADGSITANGTAVGNNAYIQFSTNLPIEKLERNKKYKLLVQEELDGRFVYVNLMQNGTYVKTVARTNKTNTSEFTITNEVYNAIWIGIQISVNRTVDNLIFKPMLVEVNDDGSYPTEYICGNIRSNIELGNEIDDLNTIVNDGSYNLIPFPYEMTSMNLNGVTFTVNEDGSVKAVGTATSNTNFVLTRQTYIDPDKIKGKKVRLSGCTDNQYNNVGVECYISTPQTWNRDYGQGIIFTFPSENLNFNINLFVRANTTVNTTFYPMLVEVNADGSYPTEYIRGNVKGNLGLTSVTDRLEKKVGYNLIPFPYVGSSETRNGVEYVAREDGTILINGTTNGNNSGWIFKDLPPTALERDKRYRISNEVNSSKIFVYVNLYRDNTYLKTIARTNGTNEFVISSSESFDKIRIGIQISHPQTLSNYVCKPMLVEVNDDGSYPTEYQKYIPSNEELGNKVDSLTSNNSITEVKIVDVLPADASSHPTTLYLCKG